MKTRLASTQTLSRILRCFVRNTRLRAGVRAIQRVVRVFLAARKLSALKFRKLVNQWRFIFERWRDTVLERKCRSADTITHLLRRTRWRLDLSTRVEACRRLAHWFSALTVRRRFRNLVLSARVVQRYYRGYLYGRGCREELSLHKSLQRLTPTSTRLFTVCVRRWFHGNQKRYLHTLVESVLEGDESRLQVLLDEVKIGKIFPAQDRENVESVLAGDRVNVDGSQGSSSVAENWLEKDRRAHV